MYIVTANRTVIQSRPIILAYFIDTGSILTVSTQQEKIIGNKTQ